MDLKLVAWGMRRRGPVPRLWLFTDATRLQDPLPAASRLPRGRAGVVFRYGGAPDRLALGQELARICRERRLVLVVAGDTRLAAQLGAGVHLRGGRWPDSRRSKGFVTSSAHDTAELRRAHRAGARLVFLSPAFPTKSHPGASGLGPARWGLTARRRPAGLALAALGGVDGRRVLRLPRACSGVGAIGALAP
jgi:thiamine-phosphate pyrophosphorylase